MRGGNYLHCDRISSVAYATDERASDEKTARAANFERRSWAACAVLRGVPMSFRFNVESGTSLLLVKAGGRKRWARKDAARKDGWYARP
jgi:hypothetical protein